MASAIQLEINTSIEAFRINQLGMEELLNGDVAKDLVHRAILVESSAKQHATGSHAPRAGYGQEMGPNVITGRLRGSITWRLGKDEQSPYADIGSAVYYAPFVELGTSRAPAYPFLRPALEAARATF